MMTIDLRVAVEIGIIVAAIAVAIVAWVWSWQFSQLVKTSLANFTDIEEPEIVEESPVETTRVEAGEEEIEAEGDEEDANDGFPEDTETLETVEASQSKLETTAENRDTDRPTDNIVSPLPDFMAIAFVPKRSRRWKDKRQQQPIAKLRQRMGAKQRRFKAIGVRRKQP